MKKIESLSRYFIDIGSDWSSQKQILHNLHGTHKSITLYFAEVSRFSFMQYRRSQQQQ